MDKILKRWRGWRLYEDFDYQEDIHWVLRHNGYIHKDWWGEKPSKKEVEKAKRERLNKWDDTF